MPATNAAGSVVAVVHAGRWKRSMLHMQALSRIWKNEFRSFMMQIHSARLGNWGQILVINEEGRVTETYWMGKACTRS